MFGPLFPHILSSRHFIPFKFKARSTTNAKGKGFECTVSAVGIFPPPTGADHELNSAACGLVTAPSAGNRDFGRGPASIYDYTPTTSRRRMPM